MRHIWVAFLFLVGLGCCNVYAEEPEVGRLEVVAELSISPGDLTVSKDGRIFAVVHQLPRQSVQLIEVFPPNTYHPWPNDEWNGEFGGEDIFNSLFGVQIDLKNRLWVIDNGDGESNQQPKLLAFDVDSGDLVYRYDFPKEIGLRGSFIQDLAVDEKNGFVYLADAGMSNSPAIIVVDISSNKARRIEGHFSFDAEDVDVVVEGEVFEVKNDKGKVVPARIGINPITLSDDYQKLYYGAMNGQTWYYIETKFLREGVADKKIKQMVFIAGEKPISDGASSDLEGNHFFTDLNNNAIVRLDVLGDLETVVQDERLSWPGALSFGPDGWLYISVNQLHKAPSFHEGEEKGVLSYYIMRVWTGTKGISGR